MSAISYNGWPASKDVESIRIKSYPVKGTKIKLRCAYLAAPLLVAFAEDFHELIEEIDGGALDDWGYCYREVRQVPGKLSNHASGSAIDLNATRHPLGRAGTFPAEKVPMIQALAKKYGLVWGGDYRNRKDEMHFEIAVTPIKAAKLIEKLGLEYDKPKGQLGES
jgi:hypothetical protein